MEDFRVAAVVLNWNGGDMTRRAVRSVMAQVDQVVVVDNASQAPERDSLRCWCRAQGLVLIENQRNLGYAGGNNVGIDHVLQHDYDSVMIMNSDALAEPEAVAALVDRLRRRPDLGAVAPVVVELENPDVVLHTACYLKARHTYTGWHDRGRHRSEITEAAFASEAISGEAFLARSETLRRCGPFDERFVFYFEDAEWSARVRRAGWMLEVVPRSVFRHAIGGSMPSGAGEYYRSRNRPIFLRIALGESRFAAARHSARNTFVAGGALVRRGHPWIALRFALLGWLVGVLTRDAATVREQGT